MIQVKMRDGHTIRLTAVILLFTLFVLFIKLRNVLGAGKNLCVTIVEIGSAI